MKKLLALVLAMLMLFALTACGGNGDSSTTTTSAPKEAFRFPFNGVELVPGAAFDAGRLPTPEYDYEQPSCAGDGVDKVYNYSTLEITVYDNGTGGVIYAVILDSELAANTPTPEGLYFGDDAATVMKLYGEDCQKDGDVWTYRKGDTLLVLQLENDAVTHIEYRMA